MMKQMARGGGMGVPGMGNLPGMGGKKSRGRVAAPVRKVKGKSGNPAKRAEQERLAGERPAAGPAAPQGSAFGLGAPKPDPAAVDPAPLQLPPGVDTLLGR
jgi:signal recognition particle subunit SRP54